MPVSLSMSDTIVGLDGYPLALAIYGSKTDVGEEVLYEFDGSLLVFVRRHRHLYALFLKGAQQLAHAGVGAAVVGIVFVVVGYE